MVQSSLWIPAFAAGAIGHECPIAEPLEVLFEGLADKGHEVHFNDIDARMARSPFSKCTNCGARRRFNYTGMQSESSYRAFLELPRLQLLGRGVRHTP